MANICYNCEKHITFGRQSTHHRGVAGKRWKKRAQVTLRTFKPNIQKVSIEVAGKPVQVKLCTDCISRFKKEGVIKTSKFASI